MQPKTAFHTRPTRYIIYFDVVFLRCFTVTLQLNSHKSVQRLFRSLHIIFLNSLNGFKVICQLEKEPLKGLANVEEIFS